jgi:hypothetical protein
MNGLVDAPPTVSHEGREVCASAVVRGGGERVKRLILASLVASSLVFMSMLSVPAVADTCCGMALKCTIELSLNPRVEGEPDWSGTVDGDIAGTYLLYERWDEMWFSNPSDDVLLPFTVEHYYEDFVIEIGDDTIEGVNQGVFIKTNLKFHYTGSVTAATGEWSYLVGWNLHGQGDVDFSEDGATAIGVMAFVPP